MDRDNETRILHFRSRDKSIRLKHLSMGTAAVDSGACRQSTNLPSVPVESIPWTDTKNSPEVSFLESHCITVIDQDGHHLYRVDKPTYKFKRLETRRRFQAVARERELIGEFDAIEITSDGEVLSKCQVIHVWSAAYSSWRRTVTLTFLATGIEDGRSHIEWDIEEFHSKPEFVIPVRIPWKKHSESKTLELSLLYPSSKMASARIEFGEVKCELS